MSSNDLCAVQSFPRRASCTPPPANPPKHHTEAGAATRGGNLWPWTHLILNTRLEPLWECVWACESVCFFKKRIAAPHEFINIQVVAVADQLCVCVHEYMEGRLTEVRTTHLLGKSCFSHADWPLVTNGPNAVTSNVTIPHQTIYLDRQLGRRTRL